MEASAYLVVGIAGEVIAERIARLPQHFQVLVRKVSFAGHEGHGDILNEKSYAAGGMTDNPLNRERSS